MRKKILNPFSTLCFGLLIGTISRLLDIFTTNLGEIFSQMAIWILLGTLISIYSTTAKKAMVNVLTFCLGMLSTYYLTAALSHGVYSKDFMIGWTAFALCSLLWLILHGSRKKAEYSPRLCVWELLRFQFCHPFYYLTDCESMIL